MSASAVVPQVLEHVDVDRWGYRKAELVRLIASLQEGPNPVPLGRKILRAMGRSERQAKYDHEVLVGLADDGVLMRWRGTGRRPDCWAVTEVARWRHVLWATPRRDVIRAFSSPLPDAAVSLWAKRAGQALRLGSVNPLLAALVESGLSVNHPTTTKRHLPTRSQRPAEEPFPSVHNATDPGASSPIGLESEFTPSLTPPSEGGRECFDAAEPGNQLLAAVRATAKTAVFGEPADRIRAVGRAHPERLDELLAFAGRLGWVRTGSGAARALEDQAAGLVAIPARDPLISQASERAYLERMLAIEERDGGDHEVISALRSQLASLGRA